MGLLWPAPLWPIPALASSLLSPSPGPPPQDRPKFRSFFPLSNHNFLSFLEFWWCFWRPGSQMWTFGHEKTLKRGKKERKLLLERGPHMRSPSWRDPQFGPHVSGFGTLTIRDPPFGTPNLRDLKRFWTKSFLDESVFYHVFGTTILSQIKVFRSRFTPFVVDYEMWNWGFQSTSWPVSKYLNNEWTAGNSENRSRDVNMRIWLRYTTRKLNETESRSQKNFRIGAEWKVRLFFWDISA